MLFDGVKPMLIDLRAGIGPLHAGSEHRRRSIGGSDVLGQRQFRAAKTDRILLCLTGFPLVAQPSAQAHRIQSAASGVLSCHFKA